MKYYDKFSDTGYHSAFLTSFTFNGDTFENIVLNRLRSSKCHNIHVVSDFRMFKQELELYGPPSQAGLRYHLALHKRSNAFHPKIVLQLGKEKARLLVGSANLTVTGLAGNKELVDEIICEGPDDPIQPLVAYAARYIQSCFSPEDDWFKQGFRRALELSPWFLLGNAADKIKNSKLGVWGVIHSEKNKTGVAQFSEMIGDDVISRLNIVSPFWDEKLNALDVLSKRLQDPIIRLGIEKGRGLFPAHSVQKFNNVSVHDLEEFSGSRSIHAKVFVAEGRKYDHVLSGSLNCSAAALLSTSNNPLNAEFGLYRRVQKGQALKQLGLLKSFKHKIDITTIEPFRHESGKEDQSTATTHAHISLNQSLLTLTLKDSNGREPSEIQLSSTVTISNWPQLTLKQNPSDQTWKTRVATEFQSANIANIVFKDGTQSGPIIVCNIANLINNSRSPSSQKMHQLLQRLNKFDFENLDIIDILLELQQAQLQSSKGKILKKAPKKDRPKKEFNSDNSVVPYEEFIELDDVRINKISEDFMGVDHRYSRDATDALNRLLGLISPPPVMFDDVDLNLNPTDPREFDGDAEQGLSPAQTVAKPPDENKFQYDKDHQIKAYRYNTADNLLNAVIWFCGNFSDNPDYKIDVTDLTHARALVQIILSNTKPLIVDGNTSRSPVLTVFDKLHKKTGWPRLIGRVVQSVDIALKKLGKDSHNLIVESGDNRIIDSLAVLSGSCSLAIKASKNRGELGEISKHIERIIVGLETFQSALFNNSEDSNSRFLEIQEALFNKFDDL